MVFLGRAVLQRKEYRGPEVETCLAYLRRNEQDGQCG